MSAILRRFSLHTGRLRPRPYAAPLSLTLSRNASSSGGNGNGRVETLMERLGGSTLELAVRESTIPGAGRGVFLQKGRLEVDQIVTLYPGTVYHLPFDLEAFTTGDDALDLRPPDILIANDYLLRFKHGGSVYMIDGCPRGISALAFTRVLEAKATPANLSWLEEKGLLDEAPCATSLQRQLALGNLLNDPEDEDRRNVRFEIFSLPQAVPLPLLSLVPSVAVSGSQRLVVAVTATKQLQADPEAPVELFVSYGTDPKAMGYPI